METVPKKVKVVLVKAMLYKPSQYDETKTLSPGSVLEIPESEAREYMHFKKAVEYKGDKKHLEVDNAFKTEKKKPAGKPAEK